MKSTYRKTVEDILAKEPPTTTIGGKTYSTVEDLNVVEILTLIRELFEKSSNPRTPMEVLCEAEDVGLFIHYIDPDDLGSDDPTRLRAAARALRCADPIRLEESAEDCGEDEDEHLDDFIDDAHSDLVAALEERIRLAAANNEDLAKATRLSKIDDAFAAFGLGCDQCRANLHAILRGDPKAVVECPEEPYNQQAFYWPTPDGKFDVSMVFMAEAEIEFAA